MNMNEVLISVGIFAGLGVLFGLLLAVASRIFAVKVDERIPAVQEALPGANCGGCGFSGCAALAEAIVKGDAAPNACKACSAEGLAKIGGSNLFLMYTIIVFASVAVSAFVDNIPYVMTMLPVVAGVASSMGVDPTVLYFGLLVGATLGGNITPVGASANITGIGMLRKVGYEVKAKEFMKISVPFTLTAVLSGYAFIWLCYGIAW